MSNLNDKFNVLNSIDSVQDLSNENAAALTGATNERFDVTIYDGENFTPGKEGVKNSNEGIQDLKSLDFNNKTSSLKVDGTVNKKVWRFYSRPNFEGESIDVNPGEELAMLPQGFDNRISSFQAIG
jgi:hypothetical protein